ncbi:ETS homologous factor-like [Pristis pectinata]|uniref:ETS homologous factor-like n=1 Tax=Pristis pectinata TaxID=685728 RepID=UPI00223DDAEA|nr:ETS homologous factor-like [Pristis pectinata]XP_051885579.1 ETS homologous factor-like [Pristis pectinata]
MMVQDRSIMNAQFRNHPTPQQVPSAWSNLDLESNAPGGYCGGSWLQTPPHLWTKCHVWEWLQHTLDANQLDANCIRFHDFDVTGEQLCSMSFEIFSHATGPLGPLLFSSLENLKWSSKFLQPMGQPLMIEQRGSFITDMVFPVNDTIKSQAFDLADEGEVGRAEIELKPITQDTPDCQGKEHQVQSQRPNGKKHSPRGTHLWEFIRDILLDSEKNPGLIKWEDRSEGVFRFLKSEAVAQLWGKKKNNSSMTYEKLSRAMRYYYKREILERVDGRRLVYKFGKNARGWRDCDR